MTGQWETQLAADRVDEMARWGRTVSYDRMRNLLEGDRRTALDLTNHGLAAVDDVLDSTDNPLERLKDIQQIFERSFSGIPVRASAREEQAVSELGFTLRRLSSARFPYWTDRNIGRHTYEEVLDFWEMEKR